MTTNPWPVVVQPPYRRGSNELPRDTTSRCGKLPQGLGLTTALDELICRKHTGIRMALLVSGTTCTSAAIQGPKGGGVKERRD